MKTGILTFHAAKNYGAVLQCRCLYEVLKSLGHEVSVIDYRPDYLVEPYKLWKRSFLRHPGTVLKVSARIAGALRRDAAFDSFIDEMALEPVDGSSFDAIFYGSDQIWNRNICRGIDPMFYAGAPLAAMTRNIAYAASDGNIIPNAEEQKVVRRYLHNFHRIGVREEAMLERMDEEGIPAVLNLDPVMLAGAEVLDGICAPPVCKEGYVLTYEAIDNPAVLDKARRTASEKHLKVISVSRTPYSGGTNKYGPKEFVALFRDAAKVVTTSYHGVVLSILFNKDYEYVRTNTPADGRIDSLLAALDKKGIDALRAQSLDFIKEALS